MQLFDDMVRVDDTPAKYAEPKFTVLNRSSRETFEAVRQELERWFVHWPNTGKENLRSRFRSENNNTHHGAFFELFLHELLLKLGSKVDVHALPATGKTTQPDFLVQAPDGSRFYLEARVFTGVSDEEAGKQAMLNDLYDALNEMESPNFFVKMEIAGFPKTAPKIGVLRRELEQWLASLDPDVGEYPEREFVHDGLKIVFTPLPKVPSARGKLGVRPIGMQSFEPVSCLPGTSIRNALLKKAGKYGDLELPYVIAVNVLDPMVGHDGVEEALFGDLVVNVDRMTETTTPGFDRNGLWGKPRTPRYTRVSAVLAANELLPWSVPRAQIQVIHHPAARKPLGTLLARLSEGRIDKQSGTLEWREGEKLASIFGLASDWPGLRGS